MTLGDLIQWEIFKLVGTAKYAPGCLDDAANETIGRLQHAADQATTRRSYEMRVAFGESTAPAKEG